MYAFTQRLFPIPWQWGRLAVIVGAGAAVLVAVGELLLPDRGRGRVPRARLLWLAYPALLWFGGVVTPEERATAIAAIREGRQRQGGGRTRPRT